VWGACSSCSHPFLRLCRLAPTRTKTRMRQDVSRQSLQPTFCQRAPLKPTNSRARGSHLADRLVHRWRSPNTLVLASDQCRPKGHRIARGHLRSRVMQRLVPLHQSWCVTVLTSVEATPVFGGVSARALGLSPAAKTKRCDHPHSLSRRSIRSCLRRFVHRGTKNLFRRTPTKASTSQAQSTFHRQVLSASSLLAPRQDLKAATGPLA
jgi:hypothetical protein